MALKNLEHFRPTDSSSAAIRTALVQIHAEREATQQQLTDHIARRTELLLAGTNAQIRAAEDATRDAELDLARLGVMAQALTEQHAKALESEAGDVRAHLAQEATAAIEAFNSWFASEYETHARAISAGLELERLAGRKIDDFRSIQGYDLASLPALTCAHVGCDSRRLSFFARLPAATAGQAPFWWPALMSK
jgi:hypothetical protein